MLSKAATVEEYIESLPVERVEVITKLHKLIKKSLPKGFKEGIGYGMICYSVPLSLYPAGYHCNPSLPLMFMSLASQKNYIALHHMGIYGSPKLLQWFTEEYPKHAKKKLDMGKGCIRFKDMNDIPYKLIAELSAKMTPQQWIECYETALNSRKPSK
ncbi:MAG: DUF1801 domain-containing protein [Bacteroidetes bacterium]|nr:DUF1801 domain-containing protein [Bacteroidota bacterium]